MLAESKDNEVRRVRENFKEKVWRSELTFFRMDEWDVLIDGEEIG